MTEYSAVSFCQWGVKCPKCFSYQFLLFPKAKLPQSEEQENYSLYFHIYYLLC